MLVKFYAVPVLLKIMIVQYAVVKDVIQHVEIVLYNVHLVFMGN